MSQLYYPIQNKFNLNPQIRVILLNTITVNLTMPFSQTALCRECLSGKNALNLSFFSGFSLSGIPSKKGQFQREGTP